MRVLSLRFQVPESLNTDLIVTCSIEVDYFLGPNEGGAAFFTLQGSATSNALNSICGSIV